MDESQQLTSEDVRRLLELFSNTQYKVNDKRSDIIQKICVELFKKDYADSFIISNENGELTSSYPSKIIVPQNASDSKGGNLDGAKLKELMLRARVARCRARFPVPIILYNGKYVCRSATLSGGPEIYGRSGLDYLFTSNNDADSAVTLHDDGLKVNIGESGHLFTRVRNHDINLLKYLSVGYICDLMVEKKKVKFGMNVTSSEKVDKECRYSDFNILSLPYPGCEFFRDYRNNEYHGEGLVYDWNQHFVDAHLIVPTNDNICDRLNIDWKNYRCWDVIKLTQNYLKLLLLYLHESDSSMLIHCISGWDRTPLFMSLLRLSLWADGKIHKTLSPLEITFLTVAYDWFFFGHNLIDRLNKGEEILFFCFYFLKFITSEEFGIDCLCANHDPKERKTSIDVSQCEEQLLLEDTKDTTGGYRGSSTSLNSSCSSSSNRSQDPPMYFPTFSEETYGSLRSDSSSSSFGKTPPTLTNSEEGSDIFGQKSPLINNGNFSRNDLENSFKNGCLKNDTPKITEPVMIPHNKTLNGNNRTSSPTLSRSDSWQLVSDTGSIRDFSTKGSFHSPDSLSSPKSNGNASETSSGSSGDKRSPRNASFKCSHKIERREKLQSVRSIFYNAYSAAIGFKFKNGGEFPTSGISSLFDQFAGTVGIYSTRVTAPH